MKRFATAAILFSLVTATVLGHAGEVHTYLGTVRSLDGDQAVITTKDGKEVPVTLTDETKYWRGTAPAHRSDLAVGTRVSVEIGMDGKSATNVKIGTSPKK